MAHFARRHVESPWGRGLLIGGAALALLLGGAGGVCRFAADCGLRGGDPFRGLAGLGTGEPTLPAGFRQEVVARGFDLPTSFALLRDGRVLVAEKDGRIVVVREGRAERRPLVDLGPRVSNYLYRGLLALEPAPDFDATGHLYVLYAVRPRGEPGSATTARVARLTVSGTRVVAERAILGTEGGGGACDDLPPGADCIPCDGDHCGGDIEFDREGAMWVSTGDGWSGVPRADDRSLRAQDLDLLAGKLLRVTPEGRGLPGNPFFAGDADDNRGKVWAYGLRNPFRLGLDRRGRPVVGNVGWTRWEELERPSPGANLGWPCFEARERVDAFADAEACRLLDRRGRGAVRFASFAYRRGAVTAGTFLHESAYPARWRGAYLYGDWSRSVLRWIRVDAGGRFRPEGGVFTHAAAGPVEIRLGPDGHVYYLAANAGELRRIRWVGPE